MTTNLILFYYIVYCNKIIDVRATDLQEPHPPRYRPHPKQPRILTFKQSNPPLQPAKNKKLKPRAPETHTFTLREPIQYVPQALEPHLQIHNRNSHVRKNEQEIVFLEPVFKEEIRSVQLIRFNIKLHYHNIPSPTSHQY